MKPYFDEDGIQIYMGDCREIAPFILYDCVLSDPPWGAETNVNARRFTNVPSDFWKCVDRTRIRTHEKIHGDDEPFEPSPWTQTPAILWGANNYASKLRDSGGWLIWDKRLGLEKMAERGWPLGEAELAWTNVIGTTRVFRNRWAGLVRSSENRDHFHPTQKPISLMAWSMGFLPEGVCLDPFMGSGTTLRAAKDLGRRAVGIEIHEPYCEIAAKRLAQKVMQF